MEHTLMDPNINVDEHFNQLEQKKRANRDLNHNGTTLESKNDQLNGDNSENYDYQQFGFELNEVYNFAKSFVKEKEGKALHFSYHNRNLLNVLAKQAYYGKYREDKIQNTGFLDLVGKDRINLWKSLSDISQEDAMRQYINLLVKVCPLFHTALEAHKRFLDEEKRKKEIEEENKRLNMSSRSKFNEDLRTQEENKRKREDIQRRQIQEALNQQTFPHFQAYAQQQHPNNLAAQQELIRQLQEQHFEQYMNQVYQQQLYHQQQQAEQLKAIRAAQKAQKKLQEQLQQQINGSTNSSSNENSSNNEQQNEDMNETQHFTNEQSLLSDIDTKNFNQFINNESNDDQTLNEDESQLPPISAATMLTRKDIKEFKEIVRKDNDAIIKVGSGETVTVRVPTHEDGRLLFWEFATDYYDIGFGLYFEWTIAPSNNVTVHVSDSSEEDELDDAGVEAKADVERASANKPNINKPPCDEIIPIFRRDSHLEVYAGSHIYPGRGVYLLKFDNSYSLWRSKTLYYRVYYSK